MVLNLNRLHYFRTNRRRPDGPYRDFPDVLNGVHTVLNFQYTVSLLFSVFRFYFHHMAAPKKLIKLLLVDDSEDDRELILMNLRRGGYSPDVKSVDTKEGFEEAL